jgi:hypothetical protein
MLFAYMEDGSLEVVADLVEARRQFEGYDVESGAVRLFDETGRALVPEFPHRSTRTVLGMRVSDDPGPFELGPAPADSERLLDAFGTTVVLLPNRWFASVDAVRAHLEGRG